MSLDLNVVAQNWKLIAISVVAFTLLKAIGVYGVARLFKANHREAVERTVLMTQGGEFAFVLYAAALGVGLIDPNGSAMLTAIIIVSMVMTPLMVVIHDRLMPEVVVDEAGMETAKDAVGTALLIGFGRFGQIVSQPLLARGYSVTTIDNDPEMIRVAASFGFKVYFGDGARLDILHAAGAGNASLVLSASMTGRRQPVWSSWCATNFRTRFCLPARITANTAWNLSRPAWTIPSAKPSSPPSSLPVPRSTGWASPKMPSTTRSSNSAAATKNASPSS